MPESNGNNEVKQTFSRLSTAIFGAEFQRVTGWVHNGSVENTNRSQLKVGDAEPHACASVHPFSMGPSLSFDPQEVNI